MNQIIIVFIGLIVQVNQPWCLDNTAVLPYGDPARGTEHVGTLQIPFAGVVRTTGDTGKLMPNEARDTYTVDLKNVDVRLQGTRGRFSTMSKGLVEALPPLSKLTTGCKLKKAVRDRTATDRLASFVDFRGGRREPDTYLPKKLSLGPAFSERCTVCSVRYIGDLKSNTAVFEFRHAGEKAPFMTVEVRAETEVTVRNMPVNATTGHFSLVYDIYEGCTSIAHPAISTEKCNLRQCEAHQGCPTTGGPKAPTTLAGEGPTAPGEDCTGGSHGG